MKRFKGLGIILLILILSPYAIGATRGVVPRSDGEGEVGTSSKKWGDGYFDDLNNVTADRVVTDLLQVSGDYTFPTATGSAAELLAVSTDTTQLYWATAGVGDVTAGANITDHSIVRGDGGAKGVQDSGVIIDDSDVMTGGTWQGTAIDAAYLDSDIVTNDYLGSIVISGSVSADNVYGSYVKVTNDLTVSGNSLIGTVTSGTWQGTAIDEMYLDSDIITKDETATVTNRTWNGVAIDETYLDSDVITKDETATVTNRTWQGVAIDESYLDSDLVTADETVTLTNVTINTSKPVTGDSGYFDLLAVSGDYTFPTATGSSTEVLSVSTDTTQLYWATAGSGDVTASINVTDDSIVRGDGGSKGVQGSNVLIDDSNIMTGGTWQGTAIDESYIDSDIVSKDEVATITYKDLSSSTNTFPSTFVTADYTGSIEVSQTVTSDIVVSTGILDSDWDTGMYVEESSDEDIIRFYAEGTEVVSIDDSGQLSSSTQSNFRGYLTTIQQLVVKNTWVQVSIDTVQWDIQSEFKNTTSDHTGYRFTAKTRGTYLVRGSVRIDTLGNQVLAYVAIHKNGVAAIRNARTMGQGTLACEMIVTDNVQMDVGDYVELWFYHTDSVSRDIQAYDSSATTFSVYKLP